MQLFLIIILITFISCNGSFTLRANGDMASTYKMRQEVNFLNYDGQTIKANDIVYYNSYLLKHGFKSQTFQRVVGIPGDVIKVDSGIVYRNGQTFMFPSTTKFSYAIRASETVLDHPFLKDGYFRQVSKDTFIVFLSDTEAEELRHSELIDTLYKLVYAKGEQEPGIIMFSKKEFANSYFYGPFQIPKKGQVVTEEILALIPNYSENERIGEPLKENYYFLLGDNRFYALDGRYVGLVPESQFLGVAKH